MIKGEKIKKISKILFLPVFFLIAVLVWYSPVVFKGITPFTPGQNEVVARNILETGKFSSENKMNVVLSSDLIRQQGVVSSKGDKLISILSAGLYRIFGIPSLNNIGLFSVIISALVLVVFSILVWQMFGWVRAVVFAVFYTLLPVIWQTSLQTSFYEYSLLFLAVALLLFFWENGNYAGVRYVLSGIFFALCFLSRDALALLAPALLIWMWFYRRKYIIHVFLSLVVTFFAFNLGFSYFFGKTSNFHLVYFRMAEENTQGKDFSFYGHLYPDPYTYLFEKDLFLNEKKIVVGGGGLESQYLAKQISNVESKKISLLEHFRLGPLLLLKQSLTLISLESVGGSLIFFLFCLGLLSLYRQRRAIFWFIILWISSVLFFTSFVALAQRNHVMDFGFAFVLGLVLGFFELNELLSQKNFLNNKKFNILMFAFLFFGVVYQLILSSHVLWGTLFEQNNNFKLVAYQNEVIHKNLSNTDIIATPLDNGSIYGLNFITDKSIIKFSSKTIEKLIAEKKISAAFNDFAVTNILGFSPEITQQIILQTGVKNIADSSIVSAAVKDSNFKSLMMNLIK